MFTGIIEDVGHISARTPISGGIRLKIDSGKILEGTNVDDSICVQGVCLTVTGIENGGFWVDAVGDTLTKTTVNHFRSGQPVNLERALRLGDRLGGHIVQGHVNGIGKITSLEKLGENYLVSIETDPSLKKYIIAEGSIAIDGISLTIARLSGNVVGISVIPHTWENTTLQGRKTGDYVNIETDMFAKYIENILIHRQEENKFTDKWFSDLGYKK